MERRKISDGIADEVRTRVQQRLALPFSLTTPAMAKYFGTSLTPVRQAVERLVAEGVLEKGANQRLALAPQWRAVSVDRRRLRLMPVLLLGAGQTRSLTHWH